MGAFQGMRLQASFLFEQAELAQSFPELEWLFPSVKTQDTCTVKPVWEALLKRDTKLLFWGRRVEYVGVLLLL